MAAYITLRCWLHAFPPPPTLWVSGDEMTCTVPPGEWVGHATLPVFSSAEVWQVVCGSCPDRLGDTSPSAEAQ